MSDWSSVVCSSDLEHLWPLDEHVRIFGAISFQRPHHRFDRIIHVEAVELLEVRDGLGLLLKDQEPVAVLERRDRSFRLVIVVERLGGGDERRAIFAAGSGRSEERSVGKECVSTCRSRWWPYH